MKFGDETEHVTSLAAAAIAAVPSIRESVLRAAGWALVVNEPIAPADIIVVSLVLPAARARSKRRTSCKAASRRALRFLPILRVETTTSSSAGGSLTRMLAQDRFAN